MHTKKSRRSYTKVLRVIFSKGCKWAGGKVRACSMLSHFSCVQLFETPWTIAHQASLSLGFLRQGYWSGLPFPSLGNLPDPGIKLGSPALQADTLPSEPPGKLNVKTKCWVDRISNASLPKEIKVSQLHTTHPFLIRHSSPTFL